MAERAALERRVAVAHRLPDAREVATGDEVGKAWNRLDAEGKDEDWAYVCRGVRVAMGTRTGQFAPGAVNMMAGMAYEHEEWLKHEHRWILRRTKRWHMKPAQLIAEGIAIGIRLGLAIAEARRHGE